MAHHCKPSRSSVMLTGSSRGAAFWPAKAEASSSSTSQMGCVSITLAATGITICSTRRKAGRAACDDGVGASGEGLFVADSLKKFTPFLLSTQPGDGETPGWDTLFIAAIVHQRQVDGVAAPAQFQQPFNSTFVKRGGRAHQQDGCAIGKHLLLHIDYRTY